MIWMGISSKGASDHKSKQTVNQETYLKECIDKRLLLFIVRMEIICFDQSTLLKYCSRTFDLKKISHLSFVLTIHQSWSN